MKCALPRLANAQLVGDHLPEAVFAAHSRHVVLASLRGMFAMSPAVMEQQLWCRSVAPDLFVKIQVQKYA